MCLIKSDDGVGPFINIYFNYLLPPSAPPPAIGISSALLLLIKRFAARLRRFPQSSDSYSHLDLRKTEGILTRRFANQRRLDEQIIRQRMKFFV